MVICNTKLLSARGFFCGLAICSFFVNIVRWLKEPHKNFPPQGGCLGEPVDLKGGVCCTSIKQKIGSLSQPTVSIYLDMLQSAGLLISERHGKWTYYRRNEETIREFVLNLGLDI